ncbi:hypothetical protein ACR3K2_15630 [Cryptosporidium serpentis]
MILIKISIFGFYFFLQINGLELYPQNALHSSYEVLYDGHTIRSNNLASTLIALGSATCNTMCDDFDPNCNCNAPPTSTTTITMEQIQTWLTTVKNNAAQSSSNPILQSSNSSPDSSSSNSNNSNSSLWVIGIVGGVIILVIIIYLIYRWYRNRNQQRPNQTEGYMNYLQGQPGMPPGGVPFMPGGLNPTPGMMQGQIPMR